MSLGFVWKQQVLFLLWYSRPCRAPWSYPVLRWAGTEHPLCWSGQQPSGLQATALHTPPFRLEIYSVVEPEPGPKEPHQNFCLSGTGTHYGSSSGSGSNIKWNENVKIERPTFWEILLLLTLKTKILWKNFCWKIVLNIVWNRNQNRNWSRNRNQNFSKVGNWTATNHYGSTTLSVPGEIYFFQ